MRWPDRVLVREVGPRDGLQNEARYLPVEVKIELIKTLAQAGVTAIEATSFVHPGAVPQLRDAEAVVGGLGSLSSTVSLSALVGNSRGVTRAAAAGVREVVAVVSASDAHNRANLNTSTGESLRGLTEICGLAREKGIRVRGAVATAFGCPYQGFISKGEVAKVVEGMQSSGIGEITLADTAGMGNPRQVYELTASLTAEYSAVAWALHFHDTRGLGLANVVAGLQAGPITLESSVGGLGGCPFLPGASGNIATEDLVYLLNSMGIHTGIDPAGLIKCSKLLEEHIGRKMPAKYGLGYCGG